MGRLKIKKVEKYKCFSLVRKLRKVTMLKAPKVYPYRNALITLREVNVDSLYPAQRYVLVDELKKIRELKSALEEYKIDIFNLDGYVKLFVEGNDLPIDLLPPVVEESIESDGSVIPLINDGMHRLYVARAEGVMTKVVYVRDVPKDLPYYAYPVPDRWSKVDKIYDLPDNFIKKHYRIADYKSLYRNFNSAFDNVGGPRGFFTNKPN